MMKNNLHNSFKETPERFRYTVEASVDEAVGQRSPQRKHIPKGWRIAIAVILIAALIPTSIFGASKLYAIIAKPVDNYGLELDIEREKKTEYPMYVKMHVEIPEGFSEVPNTDGLKFYSLTADEPYTDGYSLYPMRFYEELEMKEYIGNVDSYEERTMNGHQAYEIKRTNGGWDRLYIYYEDVNVFLLIYHCDVTDQQLEDFVKGITFTEGTETDFTYLSTPSDERPQNQVEYSFDETFIEYPLDTKLTFKNYSYKHEDESVRYTAQFGNIRTLDNISELDYDCFNPMYSPYEIADNNGYLNPRIIETVKEGDGFNSTDEILSSEVKQQKMVLADITYTNLSDEDIELYIPYSLLVLNKDDEGNFTRANSIDPENNIYSDDAVSGEIDYLTPHGIGKSFYIPALPASETITVTVGFLCNADMIDKAYFTLYNVDSVANPAYEGDSNYVSYLFKVQNDD